MKAICLSRRDFEKLEPLILDKKIINTEGQLFKLPQKEKWYYQQKILKRLYVTEGDNFGNKLYTVNALIDRADLFDERFIIPENLAVVDGKVIGLTLPNIENTNLGLILNDYNIPLAEKKAYLKQIGKILEYLSNIRRYGILKDFFIGDLHENNFILNHQTKKINVTDLDSCKIAYNLPFPAKYLATAKELPNFKEKYPQTNDQERSLNIPNENTDLYCFSIIILNLLYGDNVQRLNLADYYEYLEYLETVGVSSELIAVFSKLYNLGNNENPLELIDQLPDDLRSTHNLAFKYKTGRTLN